MLFNRDEILKAIEAKRETVSLDGGEVLVREIGATELYGLYQRADIKDEKGEITMQKFIPALITLAVIDENGNRLLSDSDIAFLEKASPVKLKAITDAAKRLNGFADDEAKN
jgi:hypothetical protein